MSSQSSQKLQNVILDLDETCISALEFEKFDEKADLVKHKKVPYIVFEEYYYIYERPHLQEFLDYLFANYNVSVWTAAAQDYALFIIKNIILKNPNRKLDYIFFSYHCKLSNKKYKNHKQMKQLWQDFKLDHYNEDNVVIIDDKEELLMNQPNNVINCKVYDITDADSDQDEDLKRIQQLLEERRK